MRDLTFLCVCSDNSAESATQKATVANGVHRESDRLSLTASAWTVLPGLYCLDCTAWLTLFG
jgi:hypothetical protein